MLSFSDLSGGYSDTQIIFHISGSVSKGEILGVFGRNGVGKTTLSKLLVGALPLSSGSVRLDDKDVSLDSNHQRRRIGIGYMPQTGMVFDNLTVSENLSLAKPTRSAEPYLETFPRLAERQDQLAGSMSGGERKILSFVRTMLEDTAVIVLDEPSEGVQPENIRKMQKCINDRKVEDTSFVLVEQNLEMLLGIADSYLGVESGRVVFEGDKKTTSRSDILDVLSV